MYRNGAVYLFQDGGIEAVSNGKCRGRGRPEAKSRTTTTTGCMATLFVVCGGHEEPLAPA